MRIIYYISLCVWQPRSLGVIGGGGASGGAVVGGMEGGGGPLIPLIS